jgi:hypothetical protein
MIADMKGLPPLCPHDARSPHPIGRVPFVGGVTRDVYEDADERPWVTGYDGDRVSGVGLPPADEPVVLGGGPARVASPIGPG